MRNGKLIGLHMNCEPQPAERNGIGLFMEGGPAVDQFASRRIREQHQYQMDGARALQRSRDLPIKTRVVTRRKRVESELPAAQGFYQRFGKRAFDAPFSLIFLIAAGRWNSEARRVGTECVGTCRFRWWPDH